MSAKKPETTNINDNDDLLKKVQEMVDEKVSVIQKKLDSLTSENATLQAELERAKKADPESTAEDRTVLRVDPAIPKVEDRQRLKSWKVSLKGSVSRFVLAEDEHVAKTLYNKFMGISTTENQYEITEVTESQIGELKEKDPRFRYRPIHRDQHNQVVRERETADQFDVAS